MYFGKYTVCNNLDTELTKPHSETNFKTRTV